tara:strand:- start:206 stop:985 length:780 start_codon:yes stop_codon:yes gene_type:complete
MSIYSKDIALFYDEKEILKDISIEIREGKITTLLGPNGAGKSSFLNIISGDLDFYNGEVLYNQRNLKEINIQEKAFLRSVMAQSQPIVFDFSVKEIVEMGWLEKGNIKYSDNFKTALNEVLIDCDIDYLKNRKFNTLSGGEQRRVHFARSLLQLWRESNSVDPCYLMLDEPTSNLDLFHQIKMMNAIKKLSTEGIGIFMILHDLNLAFKYSDYIAILKNGKIISFGEPKSIINDDVLSSAFGVKIQVNKKDDNIFINYV